MRTRLITGAAGLGLALTLAACGSDDTADVAAAPTETETAAPAPEPADDTPARADVLAGTSDLGPILIGPDGRSLYGFTNDVDAISTCYGSCADQWPPVIVSDDWVAGPGLDAGIFATTVREDGQTQLVAGRWPLYYFLGDAVPGDITGQGSGDVWFVVDLDGGLITDQADEADESAGDEGPEDAATLIATADTDLGTALVDQDGLTLYGFLPDRDAGGPSCNDACADAWPPLLVDGPDLPAGLDANVFSVMERDDGSHQLAAGIWPLYLFAGDAAPGDINGQGSGDVWFVADPDGTLIGTPGAPAPADGNSDGNSDGDSGSGSGTDY